MLVHKESGGVLFELWEGQRASRYGEAYYPLRRRLDCGALGLDPCDWWELPDGSGLAKRVRRYYPWFDPVVDDAGRLVDIAPWPRWRVYGDAPPEQAAEAEPHKRRRTLRRGTRWV